MSYPQFTASYAKQYRATFIYFTNFFKRFQKILDVFCSVCRFFSWHTPSVLNAENMSVALMFLHCKQTFPLMTALFCQQRRNDGCWHPVFLCFMQTISYFAFTFWVECRKMNVDIQVFSIGWMLTFTFSPLHIGQINVVVCVAFISYTLCTLFFSCYFGSEKCYCLFIVKSTVQSTLSYYLLPSQQTSCSSMVQESRPSIETAVFYQQSLIGPRAATHDGFLLFLLFRFFLQHISIHIYVHWITQTTFPHVMNHFLMCCLQTQPVTWHNAAIRARLPDWSTITATADIYPIIDATALVKSLICEGPSYVPCAFGASSHLFLLITMASPSISAWAQCFSLIFNHLFDDL